MNISIYNAKHLRGNIIIQYYCRQNQLVMGNRAAYYGDCKSPYSTPADCKSAGTGVFYFMAENTEVEWGIDGYRVSGGNEYVIRTSNEDGAVTNLNTNRYNEMNCAFMMHSHCWPDGTKGASIVKKGNTLIEGDMLSITRQYTRFENKGMKRINVWFKYNDTYSVFPKHYIYHKYSNNLYYYDVWVNNYYIRNVKKANDLYRNLGF